VKAENTQSPDADDLMVGLLRDWFTIANSLPRFNRNGSQNGRLNRGGVSARNKVGFVLNSARMTQIVTQPTHFGMGK